MGNLEVEIGALPKMRESEDCSLDLSRFGAAPCARLGHLSFRSQGLFQSNDKCLWRGL